MQFAGKDFLSMPAPPGYKAGVGRGAVGFSTSAERGGGDESFPRRGHRPPLRNGHEDQFLDADTDPKPGSRQRRAIEEAEAIYSSIDEKLAPKRPKRKAVPTAAPSTPSDKADLGSIAADEWASIPEATDLTHRSKRLREEERSLKRSYAAPDALIAAQQDEERKLADIRRRRSMFEAQIRAEPRNAEGFLNLARLEQEAARHKKARLVLEKGTLMCPQSPEIWIASIDMHPNSVESRSIASKACRACPESEQLWLRAVELEPTAALKAQVVHEGLLHLPKSPELWLLASALEEDNATKQQVLRTAVEFVPNETRLWLMLAALVPDGARDVLGDAWEHCSSSIEIWLALSRTIASDKEVEELTRAAAEHNSIHREEFLKILVTLKPSDVMIIQALIKALGVTEAELVAAEDGATAELSHDTRDIIYRELPQSESLYLRWAKISPEVLHEAVKAFPDSSDLWNAFIIGGGDIELAVKESDDPSSRGVIQTALTVLLKRGEFPAAEKIMVAHPEVQELQMKLIDVYEARTEFDKASAIAEKGIVSWPESVEFTLARARLDKANAVMHLKDGLARTSRANGGRARLWRELVRSTDSTIRKRAVLTQALAEIPHSGELWEERIHLDRENGNAISFTLAEALQHCPQDGRLWREAIVTSPQKERKRKLAEAVKATGGDVNVLISGGLLFASVSQMDKARDWFDKARALDPANGDVILWMYKYGMVDKSLISTEAWQASTWSTIAHQAPMEDVLEDAVRALQNPFSE